MSEKKNRKYFIRCILLTGVLASLLTLSGCGDAYPDLNEEQEEQIKTYAAAIMYLNSESYSTRLMSEEEMAVAMLRQEAHKMTPIPTPEPTKKPDKNDPDTDDPQRPDQGGESAATEDPRSYAQFFGLDGIEITYTGSLITNAYPEDGDDADHFAMVAEDGKVFFILQYQFTNANGEAAEADILSLKPKFRLNIGDSAQIKSSMTLLLDDMTTMKCMLEPQESCTAVVVFEVPEETAYFAGTKRLTVLCGEDSMIKFLP